MKSPLTLLLIIAGLLACSLLPAASAQSRRAERNNRTQTSSRHSQEDNRQNQDDLTRTVDLGDAKTAQHTGSGEQEGVAPPPEHAPGSAESEGFTQKPLLPELGHGRTPEASKAHAGTRRSARTMALLIPAPRGPLLDRTGEPLAVTTVAYQLALRFRIFDNPDRAKVLEFAKNCLEQAKKIAGKTWAFSDDQLWAHYEHRRWLPLPLTNVIRADEAEKLQAKVHASPGLELLPIYIRSYPEKEIAGHIVGYVGSKGKLPVGPINHMDPLWEQVEGRAGLEKAYNKELTGTPGVWRLMFDEQGNKILDELQIRPKPGGAVVTTLNLKWQKDAEKILSKGKRRGAMVVLDCVTGEVLVMASTPSYDPNLFIPNISQKDYDALRNDPAGPLGARAFQGRYPPASTFKVMTVASALRHNKIQENTLINCPVAITIGNHTFNNWSKTPLGDINCIRAIAMSNNPFMYQMGLRLGAATLMDTARTFGFGERTGLPIPDDPGLVPTSEYMVRNYKRDFMQGDAANLSIGQGTLLVTPLQVAHMMAGVATGVLPKLQLIKQVQDGNANVIFAPPEQEVQRPLTPYAQALQSVRKGMQEVVTNGTGGRARLSYASIAGKSGTAQWGPEREEKRLAWFAGFMPCESPRFAYVVLYEGRPREKLGGGAAAAPIVKEFFELEKNDIKAIIDQAVNDDIPTAELVEEPSGNTTPPLTPTNPGTSVTVPDNLPPGMYNPNGLPDDASDLELNLTPRQGDIDYIPGLQHQIPRSLTPPPQQAAPQQPPPPPLIPTEEIPDAEPV